MIHHDNHHEGHCRGGHGRGRWQQREHDEMEGFSPEMDEREDETFPGEDEDERQATSDHEEPRFGRRRSRGGPGWDPRLRLMRERFGAGFPGMGRGRGGRPLAQGDLRWLALDLIAAQPRHGYEIIKAVEEAFGGQYSPSPGAIYPTLTLLEETGLIAGETQGSKKLYSITEEGKAEIEGHIEEVGAVRARLDEARERFGDAPRPEIHRAMHNLRAALMVRLSKGDISSETLQAITGALDRAAGEIERS
ncbi:PadR family transcriptional regulator [Consotaella salsifontis]|uniref:DNA-binding transcriptional regulator, PadR family n=1 Tax=Consotaella salsifontis TaxID=1365950 RepID=A0A1T4P313_9HYPH|nr:PadR family transcriptional regulator [Consotaella salsifontis]SJZ85707.1 DNA-binding transcriptional regulator, PadR family [Consotaella salsifontis]